MELEEPHPTMHHGLANTAALFPVFYGHNGNNEKDKNKGSHPSLSIFSILAPFKNNGNDNNTFGDVSANTNISNEIKQFDGAYAKPKRQLSYSIPENADLKERNRIAAQQWRKRKDNYLSELEEKNDSLRKSVLKLQNQIHMLKAENKVLEEDLQFFQNFMHRIMTNK